jgi:hypothetical protein
MNKNKNTIIGQNRTDNVNNDNLKNANVCDNNNTNKKNNGITVSVHIGGSLLDNQCDGINITVNGFNNEECESKKTEIVEDNSNELEPPVETLQHNNKHGKKRKVQYETDEDCESVNQKSDCEVMEMKEVELETTTYKSYEATYHEDGSREVTLKEDMDVDHCLLGCSDMDAFIEKCKTHFITYFEKQEFGKLTCAVHSINNAVGLELVTMDQMMKQGMILARKLKIVDKKAKQQYYDKKTGHFNSEVMGEATKDIVGETVFHTWTPETGIEKVDDKTAVAAIGVFEKNSYYDSKTPNHFFALKRTLHGTWCFKDGCDNQPYHLSHHWMKELLESWVNPQNTEYLVYYFSNGDYIEDDYGFEYNKLVEYKKCGVDLSKFVWMKNDVFHDSQIMTHFMMTDIKYDDYENYEGCTFSSTDWFRKKDYFNQEIPNVGKDNDSTDENSSVNDSIIDDAVDDNDTYGMNMSSSPAFLASICLQPYSTKSVDDILTTKPIPDKVMKKKLAGQTLHKEFQH